MTKPEMTQDYEAIYLAPKCMASGEREWCEHDAPYDCDCDDGPHPWIKFVRSDIAEAAEQRGAERERERIESANTSEMPEVAAWRFVDELRSDYGSVTILPDNEEANTIHTQMAIDCIGEWTDWKERRFFGESIIQCLAKAVCEKNQAIRGE